MLINLLDGTNEQQAEHMQNKSDETKRPRGLNYSAILIRYATK